MKAKLFLFTFLFCVLFCNMAFAGLPMPMIVYGTVEFDGNTYANQPVVLENTRLDYEWTFYTNKNGVFQITLNGLKDDMGQEIKDGDEFIVSGCPVEANAGCVQSFIASYEPTKIDFVLDEDLSDDSAIDVEIVKDCEEIAGTVDCPECPDQPDSSYISELIVGVLGLLAGGAVGGIFIKRKEALSKGVGIKIYTKRDGTYAVYHKHPGIRGYHEPTRRHRYKKERHENGELTPVYEKDDTGEWAYKA